MLVWTSGFWGRIWKWLVSQCFGCQVGGISRGWGEQSGWRLWTPWWTWAGGIVRLMEDDHLRVRLGVVMWRSSERYGGVRLRRAFKNTEQTALHYGQQQPPTAWPDDGAEELVQREAAFTELLHRETSVVLLAQRHQAFKGWEMSRGQVVAPAAILSLLYLLWFSSFILLLCTLYTVCNCDAACLSVFLSTRCNTCTCNSECVLPSQEGRGGGRGINSFWHVICFNQKLANDRHFDNWSGWKTSLPEDISMQQACFGLFLGFPLCGWVCGRWRLSCKDPSSSLSRHWCRDQLCTQLEYFVKVSQRLSEVTKGQWGLHRQRACQDRKTPCVPNLWEILPIWQQEVCSLVVTMTPQESIDAAAFCSFSQ